MLHVHRTPSDLHFHCNCAFSRHTQYACADGPPAITFGEHTRVKASVRIDGDRWGKPAGAQSAPPSVFGARTTQFDLFIRVCAATPARQRARRDSAEVAVDGGALRTNADASVHLSIYLYTTCS